MSLFTKVKCKYYFQKKVDNKALSKSGRQTQLLRSTETYSRTFCQASLTVEAAVVLPLFIGFMVFLLFYFRIMQTELAVEQAMMYTAKGLLYYRLWNLLSYGFGMSGIKTDSICNFAGQGWQTPPM